MKQRVEELSKNPNLTEKKIVNTVEKILSKNDKEAAKLRDGWGEVYVVNLMSSPGSGKTTFLEELARIKPFNFGVIEGDLETNRDAQRLERVGIKAYQITTGSACHLEASMISNALKSFSIAGLDVLFIENVGNLVCPASYDLGAHLNIALLSVPEGDDKVLKYPTMFRTVDALFVTKCDLLPYFDFDFGRVESDFYKLNPKGRIFRISVKMSEGFEGAVSFLNGCKDQKFISSSLFV